MLLSASLPAAEELDQAGNDACGGPGAMTEVGLDQRTQRPKTAVVFHDLEERIVAKPAAAAGREQDPPAARGRAFAADRPAGIGNADVADELRAALLATARRARPPATFDCCPRPSPPDRCSGRRTPLAHRPANQPSGRCRRPKPTRPGGGPAASPSVRHWPQTYRRPQSRRLPAGNRPACEFPPRRGQQLGKLLALLAVAGA